jgi:hypothetical protein
MDRLACLFLDAEFSTHHVRIPHVVSLEVLEALIGLYFGDVANITHEDLFRDSMIRTKLAATADILGLAVKPGDFVDCDRFFLIGVRPLEAEPLTNAFGRHCYDIELWLRKMLIDCGTWEAPRSRGGLTCYSLTSPSL